MACLHVHWIERDGPPSVIELGEDDIVIGRDQGCEIAITDLTACRRHARIIADGDGYAVEDLNSRCGTRVGNLTQTETIRGRTRLRHGDMIVFWPVAIEFRDRD